MMSTPLIHSATRLALAALALGVTQLALAQHQHGAHTPAAETSAATPAELPWADAEVRRVDTAANKISLKHGEIKNLDMPPMTMVFQVQDPAWLQTVKPGDKLRVQVQQIQGAYTVTALEAVR